MTALVVADHDGAHLKGGTANAVAAAAKMGGDVHVLVAGSNAQAAAQAASKLAGVAKVLHVQAAHYDDGSRRTTRRWWSRWRRATRTWSRAPRRSARA